MPYSKNCKIVNVHHNRLHFLNFQWDRSTLFPISKQGWIEIRINFHTENIAFQAIFTLFPIQFDFSSSQFFLKFYPYPKSLLTTCINKQNSNWAPTPNSTNPIPPQKATAGKIFLRNHPRPPNLPRFGQLSPREMHTLLISSSLGSAFPRISNIPLSPHTREQLLSAVNHWVAIGSDLALYSKIWLPTLSIVALQMRGRVHRRYFKERARQKVYGGARLSRSRVSYIKPTGQCARLLVPNIISDVPREECAPPASNGLYRTRAGERWGFYWIFSLGRVMLVGDVDWNGKYLDV